MSFPQSNKRGLSYFFRADRATEHVLFLIVLLITGIFYSTALTTGCMIFICLFSVRFFSFEKVKGFVSDYSVMPFVLVFFCVFLTGSYSDDQQAWITAVRIKLPFLVLPFAFFLLPEFGVLQIKRLHYWLLGICVMVGTPVLINVLTHYQEMLQLLSSGQPIPTPIEHVKYSMFNAYAVVSGLILFIEERKQYAKFSKYLMTLGILFLIVLMHILAIRTGLFILYISLIVLVIGSLIKSKPNKQWVVGIIGILIIPMLACLTIPTLRQKLSYMKYDWKQYEENGGAQYSDSERLISYKAAIAIWGRAPIIGVGYGDVRGEANQYYTRTYERSDLFKLPHSQFLLTLAGGGILGFIIFLSGFYTPLLRVDKTKIAYKLLLFLFLNYSLSFIVENSLERSLSVAFFLILALLLIRSKDRDQPELEL